MNLTDSVTDLPGVGEAYARKLSRLEITTVGDLLNHFPRKYLDLSHPVQINSLTDQQINTYQCFKACLVKFNNFRFQRGFLQTAVIADEKGKLPIIWFNMPYLKDSLQVGEWYYFHGPLKLQKNKLILVSPDFEIIRENQLHANRIIPIYPETAGVSSKWLRSKVFTSLETTSLPETIPLRLITTNSLVDTTTAYHQIHFPDDFSHLKSAEERLAFNDLLSIYLKSALTKKAWDDHQSFPIKTDAKIHHQLLASLPFKLTPDQKTVIEEIFSDLSQAIPMNRLLQGDVGSGKTIVAAAAALQAIKAGHQVVIMAPTQVLAQQHFANLSQLLTPFGITPKLVTSSSNRKVLNLRTENLDLLIGTHALLKRPQIIDLARLALLVVDEQHRFGVLQRSHFLTGAKLPHILTMTATPIPRTIALSFYGHLDISYLKTLPTGRQRVKTWLTPESKRASAYDWIKQQLKKGDQAFIVCPFIEESDSDTLKNVKAATVEFERLKTVFAGFNLDLLHGRLSAEAKQTILSNFRAKKSHILVTTPVIEVGVDIPNATIIVIEGAERFGLSSLHQLRGRVGRGSQQAYCLLFTSTDDPDSTQRLKLLEKYHNGLKLARFDLQLRGAGDIFGTAQSGYLDTRFAAFWDKDLRSRAQRSAQDLVSDSPQVALKLLKALTPQLAKIDLSN